MKTRTEATFADLRAQVASGELPLIDVRAPIEFARGSIPGAINIPLLSDDERHRLGICYKTEGRRAATQLGIELFAEKSEHYVAALLAAAQGKRRAAVHCWRGGMRSGFVAKFLAAIGVEATTLKGGYKAYRHHVLELLAEFATKELLVLDGRTGAGKSDFLRSLPADVPKVDFEAIARHRGSAFGDFAIGEPSPTQQSFENQVAEAYAPWRGAPLIVVEIENVIGPVSLPQPLRSRVGSQRVMLLTRDLDDRVERLATEYARGWSAREDELFPERLKLLKTHMPEQDHRLILEAVEKREFRVATSYLLKARYDRAYDKGIKRREAQMTAQFNLTHEEDAARRFVLECLVTTSQSVAPFMPESLKPSANQMTNL